MDDFIDTDRACHAGIVAEVVPDGVRSRPRRPWAERIAANSPLVVALANNDALASFEMSLAQGLEREKPKPRFTGN